jgi:Protein of unknown function (DUF2971)
VRVYKFIDARWGEEALRRRRLKIANLNDLNDPFDGRCAKFDSRVKRRAWDYLVNSFSKTFGIICFSEKWTNPVLWSHYADQHRGLCLGFDIPDTIPLQRVTYTDQLVDAVLYDTWSRDQKREFVKSAYTTKFTDWSYEAEYRAFCHLADPDPFCGLYFLNFGEELRLRQIVFGSRFQGDAPYIRDCLSGLSDIEFITARLAFNSFSVVEQMDQRKQR